MKTKKEIALDFLRLAAKGDSREAFKLYVANDFKHHNAYFKGDAETLMLAMEESAKINPNKPITAIHAHRFFELDSCMISSFFQTIV